MGSTVLPTAVGVTSGAADDSGQELPWRGGGHYGVLGGFARQELPTRASESDAGPEGPAVVAQRFVRAVLYDPLRSKSTSRWRYQR